MTSGEDKAPLLYPSLPGMSPWRRGKVRDLYLLEDDLLIITTDRLSAFDFVLPTGIPQKGKILTCMSQFFFHFTQDIIPNHLITTDVLQLPEPWKGWKEVIEGRVMVVKRAEPLPVECVVRGYLTGSGWAEYCQKGSVAGISLPKGLKQCQKLPEPLFTPATKATTGHDENITPRDVANILGKELADRLAEISLRIFHKASRYALEKGVIISDTKMEFGLCHGQLTLIDELLTPDSSRFWLLKDYEEGKPQESYDKQVVRDYLVEIGWDKEPPPPSLPASLVEKVRQRYQKVCSLLTCKAL